MSKKTTDVMQKLKNQLADQKQMVRDLKSSVRELKQQLKDQKVALKSAWQEEIEAHTEKALSVGYELGYLEAVAAQRDAMDQLRADMDALYASSSAPVAVDFSALDDVLTEASTVHQSVPMPIPTPAASVKTEADDVNAQPAQVEEVMESPVAQEKEAESFSIESIVRDIVSEGQAALSEEPESRGSLELVLEEA